MLLTWKKFTPMSCHDVKQQEERTAENLDPKAGMRIAEALCIQLDVQPRLHELLEMVESVQVRIEEHGKRLQMRESLLVRIEEQTKRWQMFEDQQENYYNQYVLDKKRNTELGNGTSEKQLIGLSRLKNLIILFQFVLIVVLFLSCGRM